MEDIGTIGGVIVMPAFTKFVYVFPDAGIIDLMTFRSYHIDHLSKKSAASLLSNSMLPQNRNSGESLSFLTFR